MREEFIVDSRKLIISTHNIGNIQKGSLARIPMRMRRAGAPAMNVCHPCCRVTLKHVRMFLYIVSASGPCRRVLMTSAGVTMTAAMEPATIPAANDPRQLYSEVRRFDKSGNARLDYLTRLLTSAMWSESGFRKTLSLSNEAISFFNLEKNGK